VAPGPVGSSKNNNNKEAKRRGSESTECQENMKEMGDYNGPFLYSLHSTFKLLKVSCAWPAMMTARLDGSVYSFFERLIHSLLFFVYDIFLKIASPAGRSARYNFES
jgi:hypothetical protein